MSDPKQDTPTTPSSLTVPTTPSSLTMMSSSSSVSDDLSDKNFGSPATLHPNSGNPAERSQLKPKPRLPPKSRSFPERVVDVTCELHKMSNESRLFTDHKDLCPFGLYKANGSTCQRVVQALLKHSVSLKVTMKTRTLGTGNRMVHVSSQENEAEGQACFIRTGNGIVLATVKHNFCKEFNKDGHLEECLSVYLATPREQYPLHIPQSNTPLNWDARSLTHEGEGAYKFNSKDNPKAAWKYGKELEFIPINDRETNETLLEAIEQGIISTFEAVSTTFDYKKGMRVGIMACSCVDLLAQSLASGLKTGSEPFEARQGDTFITVGTITRVCDDHIEYSVNTVPGFSGAPVFLLTGNEDDEQHMKLIAIHAGFSEAIGRNFGFLVAEKVG